jgi:hypothetical protein
MKYHSENKNIDWRLLPVFLEEYIVEFINWHFEDEDDVDFFVEGKVRSELSDWVELDIARLFILKIPVDIGSELWRNEKAGSLESLLEYLKSLK